MGKFSISLKVKELELQISGDRDDIPKISAAVRQQLGGMVQPAEGIVSGNTPIDVTPHAVPVADKQKGKNRKRNWSDVPADPLDLRHDAAKFGSPQQLWSVADKSFWLLYVLEHTGLGKEVSGPVIAATFNHHFKACGTVHPPVVTRELAKAKVSTPALVGESKGTVPSLWYLTEEGKKHVDELIQALKAA